MNVVVLVGSARPASLNAQLAQSAIAALPTGADVTTFDQLHELPFYSEELDAAPPAVIVKLRDAITAADALIVVSPEFNAGPPAVLKNAIDWASRPRGAASLVGKPTAVLSATPSPGAGASVRSQVIAVLERAGAAPLQNSVGIPGAHEAFVGGELVDADHSAAVVELVSELADVAATAVK